MNDNESKRQDPRNMETSSSNSRRTTSGSKQSRRGKQYASSRGQRSTGSRNSNANGKEFNSNSKSQGGKPHNDPSWYAINSTIGEAVGSIPYNRFPGTIYHLGNNSSSTIEGVTYAVQESASSVPGVMTVDYIPGPGVSLGSTSPINIASKSVFSYIRKANAGSANYESSDLTIYLMAMDDIYSSYLELRRVYGLARQYYYVNRNTPDLIIRALGFNPEDLRNNLAQYRARLNLLAAKISSLAVPDVLDVMKRHAFMTAAVYTDSNTLMGQFYVFRKLGYYKFHFEGATGGYLEFVPYTSFSSTSLWNRNFGDAITTVETQIDQLIADQDMNIMSGDILKAYTESGCYRLQGVEEEATTPILFDENILSQIHNSFAVSGSWSASDFNLTQENNILYYRGPNTQVTPTDASGLAAIAATSVLRGDIFFNSYKDKPDWKDTLEWTRLMTTIGATIPESNKQYYNFGTEFVNNYTIVYYEALADGSTLYPALVKFDSVQMLGPDIITASTIDTISLLTQFDWHPIRYFCRAQLSTSNNTMTISNFKVWGDLKHYTTLSPNTISNLHDAAVMGEFAFNLKS